MNSRGSVTALMLLLLPVFIAAAAVAFAGAMSIRLTEKTQLICRKGLLDVEANAIQNLDKLMSLNPTARALRAADTASKLSMFIPLYGQVSSVSVEEARRIFHSIQQGIIQSSHLQIKSQILELKRKLNSSVDLGPTHFVEAEVINSPMLAVEPHPRFNITPDYYPRQEFEDLMLSKVQWQLQLEKVLPTWLSQLIRSGDPKQNFKITLSCASSVQKYQSVMKEQKWQARLVEKSDVQSQIIRAKQLLSFY